jgi:hypothetical protein
MSIRIKEKQSFHLNKVLKTIIIKILNGSDYWMKSYRKLFFILLISCLSISIFTNLAFAENNYILDYKEKENKIVTTTKHAELHIEKNYIKKEEIYNIAEKIEKGIRNLKNYLGEHNKYNFKEYGKIKYFIQSGNKISHAIRSSNSVELYHVHLKQSPYIHETAHILLDENQIEIPDSWLSEGLPTYLNSKFAVYPPELVGDKNNPEELTKDIIRNEKEKYELQLEYFPKKFHRDENEKWVFYSFAGSFVKFIKNKYGKEKLLELYQVERKKTVTILALEDNSNKDTEKTERSLEQLIGTSLNELKKEWLDSLQI